jgi:hypothetical protein
MRRLVENRINPTPISSMADATALNRMFAPDAPDLALAASPRGEAFMEWFEGHQIDAKEWEPLIHGLPVSRLFVLADRARQQSHQWERLSTALDASARGRASASQPSG